MPDARCGAGRILANPFLFIDVYRDRVEVLDLGDGTAAVLYEDEPVFGGFLAMTETEDGWKFAVPIELVQTSEYWPQTRWEWSVVASMLLSIESATSLILVSAYAIAASASDIRP